MKSKLAFIFLCAVLLGGAVLLTGCEDETALPALADDDDLIDDGDGGDAVGVYLGNYTVDTDFVIQVWNISYGDLGPTCAISPGADGGLRITTLAKEWAGGSLAAQSSGFNFSQVKSITFKVRSNLPANNIKYILGTAAAEPVVKYLSASSGVTLVGTLNDTTWTDVTIDVSAGSALNITSAFSFVFDPAPIAAGKWAEFKSIDWVDASGASVSIIK